MKKFTYFLLMFLISFSLQAQDWMIYEANELPSETEGKSLEIHNTSQNNAGENFVEEIVDDPLIPGNKLLHYVEPDGDSTKMYQFRFAEDHTSQNVTIVARLKGLPSVDTLDRVFDIQYRNGSAAVREELRIGYDNMVGLDRAGSEESIDNVRQWHIYRFVAVQDSFAIFVDEQEDPLVTGTSTSESSDNYIKIGDGSSSKVGGYLDWIIVDTTGAYSPADNPVPASLTGLNAGLPSSSDQKVGRVMVLTNMANTFEDGTMHDQFLIDSLRNQGYNVDVSYPTNEDFSFSTLNNYDLVVIARSISSGAFSDKAGWANVQVPVIVLSGYAAKSDRMGLINTTGVERQVQEADEANMDVVQQAIAADPDDPAFEGITLGAENEFGYLTWFYDYIGYGADTFETNHAAKLLASLTGDEEPGDGAVLMARWSPGEETYEGSGVTPASYRTYMQMGADDDSQPDKILNFNQFTEASYQVFLNEVDYLIQRSNKIVVITRSDNLTEEEELLDQFLLDSLVSAGYEVATTYPNEEDFSYSDLNSYDLVIIARNVSSGAFQGLAAEWAQIQAPVMTLSAYIARQSRLNLIAGDGVKRQVDVADEGDMGNAYLADIHAPGDLAFEGVDLGAENQIDYYTWFYDYLEFGADTFDAQHNGKLLASLSDEGALGDGVVLMARWEPGIETYQGSGTIPNAYRTYMQMGADDNSTPDKIFHYDQFTDASYQVFLNEVNLLIKSQPGKATQELSADATLASIELGDEALAGFDPETTQYQVEIDGTDAPEVTATANDDAATVEIAQAEGVPGEATITVSAEDGFTTQTYTISFVAAGSSVAQIAFVGTGATPTDGDQLIIDRIEAFTHEGLDGVSVQYFASTNVASLDSEEELSQFDALYVSESINSSDATPIRNSSFPIRTILGEPWSGGPDRIGFADGGAPDHYENIPDVTDIVILVDHPLVEGFDVGESVTWTNNPAGPTMFGIPSNEMESTLIAEVAGNSGKYAIFVLDSGSYLRTLDGENVVADDIYLKSDVAVLGFHMEGVELGGGPTENFYTIIDNAVRWALNLVEDVEPGNPNAVENPDKYQVDVYPNPFNQVANFNFRLKSQQMVQLQLIDQSGRLVKELISGELPAGLHNVDIGAKELKKSGVYIYRFISEDYTQTGKIILVK